MAKRYFNITEKDLHRLQEKGKIRGFTIVNKKQVLDLPKPPKAARKNKFNAQRVQYDGHWFDSKKECTRYQHLLILLKAGLIGQLKLQVEYPLDVQKVKPEDADGEPEYENISIYIADFVYIDAVTGKQIVEDVKSDITRKLPAFRYKKRLMKALWGITVIEV